MKRILILIFVLSFIIVKAASQVAVHDAIDLSTQATKGKKIILNSNDFVLGLLKEYTKSKSTTREVIIRELSDNPFIEVDTTGLDRSAKIFEGLKPGLSKIGGLDVTNVAQGLASFMVERTKQELNTYFFEEFAERINNTVELQILFPQTYALLKSIGSEIYNYNAYITGLRESFEVDLSNLYTSLPVLIDNDKYKKAFDSIPVFRYMIKSGFYIVNQLNSNVHPGDILHSYPDHIGIDPAPVNLYNAIRVIDLFSQSLRSMSRERYWITQDSLRLLYDTTTFRIYLGLIYQIAGDDIYFKTTKGENIKFREQLKKLGEATGNLESVVKEYEEFLNGLGTAIENTQLALKKIKESRKDYPDPAEVYAFINSTLSILDFSQKIALLPGFKDNLDLRLFNLIDTLTDIADQGAKLFININDRKYGTAIINVLQLIDYGFTSVYNKSDELETVIIYIRKYGSFMASVVTAENSDGVQAAIESFTLPTGSYRIKRESKYNVSLNSYLGFFGGYEFLRNIPNGIKWPNNLALSAPVGISFTRGAIKKNNTEFNNNAKGSAIGGFISLIDVGALASFRFADTTTQVASKVELKHILAPGIFLNMNCRNAPVTFLLGAQIGPLLREVTDKEFKQNDNFYWRVGCSVVVDIPIFNLYNKL